MDRRSQLASRRDDILRLVDGLPTPAVSAASTTPNEPFVPRNDLARELNRERIKTLLDYDGVRDVSCDTIHEDYLAVFGILVWIRRTKYISDFVRYEELADTYLPFHNDNEWPSDCSGFFDDFKREQWKFCAQEFRPGKLNDSRIRSDKIIPIVARSTLSKSPDSIVENIVIHPDYDLLSSKATNSVASSHTFVLKSYDEKHESLYYNEINAYKRLTNANIATNIVQLHGSWKHRGISSILLEFVNGGTLNDLFLDSHHPTSPHDRWTFWHNLLRILEPLGLLHQHNDPEDPTQITEGVHQDIKPANILISKDSKCIPFDYTFKLVDMGLAYFKTSTTNGPRTRTKDARGTQTYCAPECARIERDPYDERRPDDAYPSKDIWSLGCVFSLALVWTVLGPDKVKSYRHWLEEATARVPQLTSTAYVGCFHDGEKMLEEVSLMHIEVLRAAGNSDHIIRDLVPIVENMLYHDIKERPSAKQIRRLCQAALSRAHSLLAADPASFPTPFLTRSERASQLRTPPELPMEFDPNGLGINLSHRLSARSATSPAAVGQGIAISHRPKRPHATHATHVRQDSIDNVIAYHPSTRILGSPLFGSHQNEFDMVSDHASATEHVQLTNQTMPHATPRNTNTLHSHSNGSRHENCVTTPHLNHERQFDRSPEAGPAAQRHSTTNQNQHHPDLQREATIDETHLWIRERKNNRAFTNKTFEDLLSLREVKNRDQVFLIDNSQSMRTHWRKVRKTFEVLGYLVKKADPDGMELFFTNSDTTGRSRDRDKLLRRFDSVQHRDQGGLESALSEILDRFTDDRSLAHVLRLHKGRAVNIYVLTDGIWEGENESLCGIDDAIRQTVAKMKTTTRKMIGIQFIQFGNNATGTRRLRVLDDGLGEDIMDIIDHTHADGNVFKMLRGATNSFWDDQPSSPTSMIKI